MDGFNTESPFRPSQLASGKEYGRNGGSFRHLESLGCLSQNLSSGHNLRIRNNIKRLMNINYSKRILGPTTRPQEVRPS